MLMTDGMPIDLTQDPQGGLAQLLNLPAGQSTIDFNNNLTPAAKAAGLTSGANPMMMAALGGQAMKNINGMMAPQPPMISPGGAGVAPRGQQVKLETPNHTGAVDPRLAAGLASLLFAGGK